MNTLINLFNPLAHIKKHQHSQYHTLESKVIENETLMNVTFSGPLFSLTTFKGVTFESCSFFAGKIENCQFIDCHFINCRFEFMGVSHCQFKLTSFDDCLWEVSGIYKTAFTQSELCPKTSFLSRKRDGGNRLELCQETKFPPLPGREYGKVQSVS